MWTYRHYISHRAPKIAPPRHLSHRSCSKVFHILACFCPPFTIFPIYHPKTPQSYPIPPVPSQSFSKTCSLMCSFSLSHPITPQPYPIPSVSLQNISNTCPLWSHFNISLLYHLITLQRLPPVPLQSFSKTCSPCVLFKLFSLYHPIKTQAISPPTGSALKIFKYLPVYVPFSIFPLVSLFSSQSPVFQRFGTSNNAAHPKLNLFFLPNQSLRWRGIAQSSRPLWPVTENNYLKGFKSSCFPPPLSFFTPCHRFKVFDNIIKHQLSSFQLTRHHSLTFFYTPLIIYHNLYLFSSTFPTL